MESQLGASVTEGLPLVFSRVGRLAAYDGGRDAFLQQWFADLCRTVGASAGGLLRHAPEGVQPLVLHPDGGDPTSARSWLKPATDALRPGIPGQVLCIVLREGDGMYGTPAGELLILVPLLGMPELGAVAALTVPGNDRKVAAWIGRTVAVFAGLLTAFEHRAGSAHERQVSGLVRRCLEILTRVQGEARFTTAAMVLCNELSSRFQARRVGLGVLRGRAVHVVCLDHTENFSRRMGGVRVLEAAMEECADQQVPVVHPAGAESPYVARDAAVLARESGALQVVSVPVVRSAEVVMVLTVEFGDAALLDLDGLSVLRLLAELAGPRLHELRLRDAWFGVRWWRSWRQGLAWILGPTHTWIKAGGLAVFGVLCFAVLVQGMYRVEAPHRLEATVKQVVAAPYQGYLSAVEVLPGDQVEADAILARLDDSALRKELTGLRAEAYTYEKQADLARREGRTAEAQIAMGQHEQVQARIDLLNDRLLRSVLRAGRAGWVASPDLHRHIGRLVRPGEQLMELAAADSLRGILHVSEADIREVEAGFSGELIVTAHPGLKLGFTVERIQPVATVVDRQNVFEVWVRLVDRPEWLRPAMAGEARIDIGRRRFIWIWTHRLVDWVRMKLWI